MDKPEIWIRSFIEQMVATDPDNCLNPESDEKAWDSPLVGFASGIDPLFPFYKKDIGEFFWLPIEAFKTEYPDSKVSAEELSVISWVIPHTKPIKMDHRKSTTIPAEKWARARLFGEAYNNKLRKQVTDMLCQNGYPAVSPMLSPAFQRIDSQKYGYASSWSERHAAYACGHGTFGLSDGLITPVGKAVRFGSVIAKISLEPSERPYNDHHAYCLYYRDKSCTKCIERCPVDAISEDGHDKVRCKEYIRKEMIPAIKSNYNLDIQACGLCQAKVPCESKIPKISTLSD